MENQERQAALCKERVAQWRPELARQARMFGEYASRPEHLSEFGLVAGGAPELDGAIPEMPDGDRYGQRAGSVLTARSFSTW